jgi:hypothetical protein
MRIAPLLFALFLSIYLWEQAEALRYLSSTRRRYRRIAFLKAHDEDSDNTNWNAVDPYVGPLSVFEFMEAGCAIEDLGIQVMVGESSLVDSGRGLFVAILEDADEVILPKGTPICGYSKGYFTCEAYGDKAVSFQFDSVYTGCIFEKKLMPLIDAIGMVCAPGSKSIVSTVLGHRLDYIQSSDELKIIPDESFLQSVFIPHEDKDSPEWGPGRLGMYANDLAFFPGIDKRAYEETSAQKNALQLVWRLANENGVLVPTWPVVLTLRDLKLTNYDPMEIGIQYGWGYWEKLMEQQQKLEAQQKSQKM